MNAFSIGLSALQTGQSTLDLIGQNLANATTPGYHRQVVDLVARTTAGTGTGVDIASVTRFTSPPVRTAILRGNADRAAATAQLDIEQQVQTTLTAGSTGKTPGGVGDGLTSLFNQITQLTSTPSDPAVRRTVVSAASALAGQFNSAAAGLDNLRNTLGGQISQTVTQVNTLAGKIAALNAQIANVEGQGGQANNLHDQRDQLIDQLSKQVDVRTVDQPNGVVNVLSSGGPIVLGQLAVSFQVGPDASGNLAVTPAGSAQPQAFASGTLAGQLQEYNQGIPATRGKLDTLANTLSSKLNEIQATGLGTAGPLTATPGTVSVVNPAAPLASQNLPAPVQAGQLVVSVTTTATGQRTNTTIAIDPSTQSLQNVATALNGVAGLQASVNPATNTLQITAQAGYAFDFAGRDTNPPTGGPVSNPDTAGVLAGLGVNGLFSGTGAANIAVNPAVAANPGLLATSRTGQPGDETNLERMAAVQTQAVIGGQTLAAAHTDLAATVGSSVQQLGDQQSAQAGILQNLTSQEQSVTGVDQNEEMVHLLGAQQSIQAASQYMSAVNTALDAILQIIK
ncbi:MAG: flgK [Gemmataceae bacterium]|nr:flgK [Gemmataceae bacterium]